MYRGGHLSTAEKTRLTSHTANTQLTKTKLMWTGTICKVSQPQHNRMRAE